MAAAQAALHVERRGAQADEQRADRRVKEDHQAVQGPAGQVQALRDVGQQAVPRGLGHARGRAVGAGAEAAVVR